MKKFLSIIIIILCLLISSCSQDCSHKNENNDHICDSCGEKMSECVDSNSDNKCDVCLNKLSNDTPGNETPGNETPGNDTPGNDTPGNDTPDNDTPDNDTPSNEKQDITGVVFSSASFVYDGTEKSIAVSGSLPEGVSVTYTNAKGTDAGVYNAVAKLVGEGYNDLTLSATLTIGKADLLMITADGKQKVDYNENAQLPTYNGSVPDGVTVKYYFNNTLNNTGVTDAGMYNVKIVFEGKNYNKLELNVEFEIKDNVTLGQIATVVIDSFGSVPDAWEFFPESFAVENRLVASNQAINYSDFVELEDVPYNGMGKQLNMVYGVMNNLDEALSYVNVVYGSMNIVKDLYTAFLDENPEEFKSFTGNAGAFTFTITLDDSRYYLLATVGDVEVLIASDTESGEYGARIQLTETTVLKYVVKENELTIAVNILGSASMLLEFVRDDEIVTGMVYEFLSVAGYDLVNTSAMIYIDEDYTTLIGTKGDFLPLSDGRNCEIYDNATGEYVGAKVREDEKGLVYNTYWFPLNNVTGINNIKMIEENNGELNPFTVYINDSTTQVAVKRNLAGYGSRHFDIEFKSMYFFTYNEDKECYESVEILVPMIFIQQDNYEDFVDEFYKANKSEFSSKPQLLINDEDLEQIDFIYTDILAVFDELKDAITIDDVKRYCGIITDDGEE